MSVSELIVYMRCGYTGLYIHGIAALNNPNTHNLTLHTLNGAAGSNQSIHCATTPVKKFIFYDFSGERSA